MLRQWVWLILIFICVRKCLTMTRCPDGWVFNSNASSCYYANNYDYDDYDKTYDFYSAEKKCKQLHQQSDLVTIGSLEELQLIKEMVDGLSHVWLRGLTNYSLVGSDIDWKDADESKIGNGEYCLTLSWAEYLMAEDCFYSKGTQLICELSGEECEVENDRGFEQSSCIDVDCMWSEWSGFCQCSGENNGTWARTRSLNNYQDPNITCGDEYQFDQCNSECAPKDCSWGEWSAAQSYSYYRGATCHCTKGLEGQLEYIGTMTMTGKLRGSRRMNREKVEQQNEWGSCSGEDNKDEDCTAECDSDCKWEISGPCTCHGFGFSGEQEMGLKYNSWNDDVFCPSEFGIHRYEQCVTNCLHKILPDISMPDLDGEVMLGMMMSMVTYWMAFMLLLWCSLFIFAFVVVYYIMKREIMTNRFQGSKSHMI